MDSRIETHLACIECKKGIGVEGVVVLIGYRREKSVEDEYPALQKTVLSHREAAGDVELEFFPEISSDPQSSVDNLD